jgi:phosphonate transport system ATP-binding protein
MDRAIETRNLSKVYPDGTRALKDVSLRVEGGEFAAVIGRSGAGKSTLLRCINGLAEPTSGEVFVGCGRRAGRSALSSSSSTS